MDSNTVLRLGAAGLLGLVLFGAALALRVPDVPKSIRVFPAVVPADPLAAGIGAAGVSGARAGAGALVGATSFAARGGAAMAGDAATAYSLASASSGESGLRRLGAGITGVTEARIGAATEPLRRSFSSARFVSPRKHPSRTPGRLCCDRRLNTGSR